METFGTSGTLQEQAGGTGSVTPEVTPEPVPEVTPEPVPEVTPEPVPEPTPTVKPKDPESLYQNTAGEGLEGNLEKNEDITKDEENKGTEEAIRNEATDGGNGSERTEETQIGGLNQSQEEQEQVRQNQTEANRNDNTSSMTNDEILDYLDQFYNRIYDQQREDGNGNEN